MQFSYRVVLPRWARCLAALCTTMLEANRALFAAGHIEAAYHALASALHCATDAGDAPTLHELEAVATEQHQHLIARLATTGARRSGVEATRWAGLERIYHTVIQQAKTRAVTVELRARTGASSRDGSHP